MHGPLYEKKGMIVTTFASHIERVQAIADIAKKSHREIYFLGRSMERFCGIAQKQGILKLPKNASIYGSPKAVNKALMRADEDREKYLLVTTGHQGEPDALLCKRYGVSTVEVVSDFDDVHGLTTSTIEDTEDAAHQEG